MSFPQTLLPRTSSLGALALTPTCPGCPGNAFNVLILTIPCGSPDCNSDCFDDPTWGPSCQSVATFVRNDDLCADPPCEPADAACQDILSEFGNITAAYLNSGEPVFGSQIVCAADAVDTPVCPQGYTYDYQREICVPSIPFIPPPVFCSDGSECPPSGLCPDGAVCKPPPPPPPPPPPSKCCRTTTCAWVDEACNQQGQSA
jgi:hypothetical protein